MFYSLWGRACTHVVNILFLSVFENAKLCGMFWHLITGRRGEQGQLPSPGPRMGHGRVALALSEYSGSHSSHTVHWDFLPHRQVLFQAYLWVSSDPGGSHVCRPPISDLSPVGYTEPFLAFLFRRLPFSACRSPSQRKERKAVTRWGPHAGLSRPVLVWPVSTARGSCPYCEGLHTLYERHHTSPENNPEPQKHLGRDRWHTLLQPSHPTRYLTT